MNDTIDNDTGEFLPVEAQTISPIVAAEVSQQIATAKQYPRRRDLEISNEIMGRAALNESIATECMYSLKRGDNAITGPSVRFAEIVQGSFGNIRVAARFVRIDQDDPSKAAVIVEAVAHDLQTNNAVSIQVRRSVMTSGKGGRRAQMYSADMINMTVNAAASLARRNAVLAVVPKAVWIEGYQRAVKVIQGDATTLARRRQEIFDAFGRIKVEPGVLHGILGTKSIEDVTLEHMPTLAGMMTAIRDGESVDSVVGRYGATESDGHEKVANPLKDEPPVQQQRTAEPAKEQPKEQIRPQETENPQQTVEKTADKAVSGSSASGEIGQAPASGGSNAGPGKATGEVSVPPRSQPADATGKAAPAASQGNGQPAPDFREADDPDLAYIEFMKDEFDRAKTPAVIVQIWGKTRADRRELLSSEQIASLEKEKDEAVTRLKGGAV